MRAIIFANGLLSNHEGLVYRADKGDMLIAADGGARHCWSLGLKPDVVIGDMDSLSDPELERLENSGAEIIRHPVHKDYTDLELAIRLAVDRGASEILILAALGERWDMTLANIMLLTLPDIAGADVRLIDGPDEIRLLKDGASTVIEGRQGDVLSLVPVSGSARGVTLHGLRYPLDNAVIHMGSTHGVSNVMLGERARVELKEGMLLCIHRFSRKARGQSQE